MAKNTVKSSGLLGNLNIPEVVKNIENKKDSDQNTVINASSKNKSEVLNNNQITQRKVDAEEKYIINNRNLTKSIFELTEEEIVLLRRKKETRSNRRTFLLTNTNYEWIKSKCTQYCMSENALINELIEAEIQRETEQYDNRQQ